MKNINKSNIMGLIGMDVINIKNEVVGTVVGDFNGKYIINVDGEEKFYSESTLIRNWKTAYFMHKSVQRAMQLLF